MKRRDAESTERKWKNSWMAAWLVTCGAALFLFAPMCASTADAQEGARLLKPADVVRSQVYVSVEPVPRGRRFEIAVVGEVAAGYHVQASKVLEDYLIPLALTADLPPGMTLVNTNYPRAQLKKFPFAQKAMAVYEGKVIVRMTLEAGADAAVGPLKIPLSLRYQACSDQFCLPPVKIPLSAELTVAPAGTPAKNIHTEVFASRD
jgi:hypothetical protein